MSSLIVEGKLEEAKEAAGLVYSREEHNRVKKEIEKLPDDCRPHLIDTIFRAKYELSDMMKRVLRCT